MCRALTFNESPVNFTNALHYQCPIPTCVILFIIRLSVVIENYIYGRLFGNLFVAVQSGIS